MNERVDWTITKLTLGESSPRKRKKKDLLRSWSAIWLWGVPTIIANVANGLFQHGVLTATGEGIIQSIYWLWMGVACIVNAARCGRVHCRIDGTLLPLLAVVGLLNVVGIFAFRWVLYSDVGLGIVILSFAVEFAVNRISRRQNGRTVR